MEKTYQLIYFLSFILSFIIIFYLLFNSNFEKCFKQGKIEAIKVAMFMITFILSSLFAFGMKNLMEAIYTLVK